MVEIVKKSWGREEWIENNENYCGKKLVLEKAHGCSYHHHKIKDETFYVDSGLVLLILDGENKMMKPGDTQRILPGQWHRFIGFEDSVITEFSTHHEDSDSYRDLNILSGLVDLDKIREELGLPYTPSLIS